MNELISGREAWLIKEAGGEIDYKFTRPEPLSDDPWVTLTDKNFKEWSSSRFLGNTPYKFRKKKEMISLNGFDIPAPVQNPEYGKSYFVLDDTNSDGYSEVECVISPVNLGGFQHMGLWDREEDIKIVVESLQMIFTWGGKKHV